MQLKQYIIAVIVLLNSLTAYGLEVYEANALAPVIIGQQAIRFPTNYFSARQAFRSWGNNKKFKSGVISVPSSQDPDLTMDYIFFPSSEKSGKLVILTSGIHGAEAPAGHAIQELVFKEFISTNKFPKINYLFIHSINPFGFKYYRRVTENNIDLNRNFATPEEFATSNSDYEKLKKVLEPKGEANTSWVTRWGFYAQAAFYNIRYGKKTFLQALRGQYKEPQGVFYGGTSVEPQIQVLQNTIREIAAPFEHIYHIDLHTGFGEKGKLHLFGSDELQPKDAQWVRDFFSGYEVDTGHDQDFYSTYGDFSDWMWRTFEKKKVISMTFEFGTKNSQTLRGGLDSLWTTVTENQGHQNKYVSIADQKRTRNFYENLFNPASPAWQQQVLEQGHQTLLTTFERFEKL
ncbi:MAG: DUF2817 domain-containing protein [Bdellovibrionales bacterium]|nr:DUF2817 domain-containing protein [Bdellovibrionales bacterium]